MYLLRKGRYLCKSKEKRGWVIGQRKKMGKTALGVRLWDKQAEQHRRNWIGEREWEKVHEGKKMEEKRLENGIRRKGITERDQENSIEEKKQENSIEEKEQEKEKRKSTGERLESIET